MAAAVFFQTMVYTVMIISVFASPSRAELKSLTQSEMKTATAQAGFTDFTLSHDTARLFLDIHIETYATIDSFSAGYYNGGWDQKWNEIQIGESDDNPLTIDGLVFIADFEEGSLSGTPVLERVIIGSNRLQGSISAIMKSYTGMYSAAVTGGGSPDTILRRADLSGAGGTDRTTFNFDSNGSLTGDKGLFFVLNVDSSNVGLQVLAGYNEKSIPAAPSGPWWDSP